jgi:acyl carrier protein
VILARHSLPRASARDKSVAGTPSVAHVNVGTRAHVPPGHFANLLFGGPRMSLPLTDALKRLIVDALMLEDLDPSEIEDDAPLFGSGLGLDSIDALELAIAIDKKYGVKIEAEDERNKEIFRSVASLSAHIADKKIRG